MSEHSRIRSGRSRTSWSFMVSVAAITVAVTILFAALSTQPLAHAQAAYVTPQWAIIAHLTTVLPSLVIGAFILRRKKGGLAHRAWGRIWVSMMVTTSIASFWIRPPHGGLSAIHIFSIATLIALPIAIWRIKVRDVQGHRQILISLYIGLLVAGAFALAPDRLAGQYLVQIITFVLG